MNQTSFGWAAKLWAWLRPAKPPAAASPVVEGEYRVCHNDRCGVEFKPWRKDQVHCNAGCAVHCLPCTRPRRRKNYLKERARRDEIRGVPRQPRYEPLPGGRRPLGDR